MSDQTPERQRLAEAAKGALNAHGWTYLPKRDGLIVDGILLLLVDWWSDLGADGDKLPANEGVLSE